MLKLSQLWPVRPSSSWLLCSSVDVLPSDFEHYLLFDRTRYWIILNLLSLGLTVSLFLKEQTLVPFRNQDLGTRFVLAASVSFLLSLHMQTFISVFLYLSREQENISAACVYTDISRYNPTQQGTFQSFFFTYL